MAEIIICDTNAVIQLAIICPSVLNTANPSLNLVVHPLVKEEIRQLQKDSGKASRLGPVLDIILQLSPTRIPLQQLGNTRDEDRQHRWIRRIEQTLDASKISAGSSHRDRQFLILARNNKAKLLTNEGTLYYLSIALLGSSGALRLSEVLEQLLSQGLLNQATLQSGLDKLPDYGERLRAECAAKRRAAGFNTAN